MARDGRGAFDRQDHCCLGRPKRDLNTVDAQYYSALGNPIGVEFSPDLGSNAGTTQNTLPRVVSNTSGGPAGGYLIAYRANSAGDFSAVETMYDASGAEIGVATDSGSAHHNDFVSARSMLQQSSSIVNLLVYQDDGVNGGDISSDFGIVIVATAGLQTWPDIALISGTPRYVVSWWDDQTTTVKARVFDVNFLSPTTDEIPGGIGRDRVGHEPVRLPRRCSRGIDRWQFRRRLAFH